MEHLYNIACIIISSLATFFFTQVSEWHRDKKLKTSLRVVFRRSVELFIQHYSRPLSVLPWYDKFWINSYVDIARFFPVEFCAFSECLILVESGSRYDIEHAVFLAKKILQSLNT